MPVFTGMTTFTLKPGDFKYPDRTPNMKQHFVGNDETMKTGKVGVGVQPRNDAMTPFSWSNPYAWPRKPLLAQNVVATSQPLAAQAGLQMLAGGGNAVDAILATAITLTLVEPVSNGIGSDAYAIVWDGKKLHGLNASGRSPAGWTPEYFRGQKAMPTRGWNTVSVPGCVSAWRVLSERFGKIAFEKLFEPA